MNKPLPPDKTLSNSPDNTRQIPAHVIDDLNKSDEKYTMTMLGFILAVPLGMFSLLITYKIIQSFGTEHAGFAIMFGIPLAIVLYFLTYKSTQVGKGKFSMVTDDDGEFIIGEKSVLPKWLSIPFKTVSTLAFGYFLYIGMGQLNIYIILISATLLALTHYDSIRKLGWINDVQFGNITQKTMVIVKFGAIVYLVYATLKALFNYYIDHMGG